MWSIGCIFAELFTFDPVFRTGKMDLLEAERLVLGRMFKLCGNTNGRTIAYLKSLPRYVDLILGEVKMNNYIGFDKAYPEIKEPLAVDLIEKMLHINPKERITAKEAMNHEFFKLNNIKEEVQTLKKQT